MKVIHITCVAPPQIGGIGRVASTEVEALRARGIEALFIAPSSFPSFWSFGNAAALDYRKLQEVVSDADVVHLHYPFYGTAGMIARLRALGKIKRLVITLHMDATATGFKGWYFDLHRRFMQSRILNAADALIVSSRDYAAHSSFAPWKEKVIELPFGVDEARFTPMTKQSGRTIVFVGGMDTAHAFKGVDVLLRAFTELPQDARLVLGGEGDLRAEYERLAKDLGVADRVEFLGRISDENLPDVYRRGDVLAFPSTSSAEAFGLVALEAQACGVPVVASDLPGVRIVVEDKVTGFLSPSGDAQELAAHLRLILENPGMRDEFGRAARQRVIEKFTWKKHLDGLIGIYQKICASRS